MYKLTVLMFGAVVLGCTIKTSETNSKEESDESVLADSLNQILDSAINLYDHAIRDFHAGLDKDLIKQKYNSRCSLLHLQANRVLDSLAIEFQRQDKSEKEYNAFVKELNIGRVRKSAAELAKYGIVMGFGN